MKEPRPSKSRKQEIGCRCACPICDREFFDTVREKAVRAQYKGAVAAPCAVCLHRLIEVGREIAVVLETLYEDRWTLVRLDHD